MHVFTVDFEEWFQIIYGKNLAPSNEWHKLPSEIEEMTQTTLKLLYDNEVSATFFCVGWLAEKFPQLIRDVCKHGHSLASHSFYHRPVFELSRQAFFEDALRSRETIQQVTGKPVLGYRAPGYSINSTMPWALDYLLKAGYKYDSSLLHVREPRILSNGLVEIPPNSLRIWKTFYPINGGMVFRFLPYKLYAIYISMLERIERPLIFYTHTWEIHPPENRLNIRGIKKFLQYYNTINVSEKLEIMVRFHKFCSIEQKYELLLK